MKFLFIIALFFPLFSQAATNEKSSATSSEADFDTLGGNRVILDRAKALAPEQTISVVQNRQVSRTNRVEIAPEFSGTFGGDTYSRTKSLGLNIQYHFNPRWSVGLKYNYSFNKLTPEGDTLVDQAYQQHASNPGLPSSAYPQVDYQKSETLALVNWYPFYGKMNLMDKAVAHFDAYFLGGYGKVDLASGSTSTYTAGGGLGFWINQHFSTRAEIRYENYKAQYFMGEKSLDLTIASIQMGWLL